MLPTPVDWTPELIEQYYNEIEKIALEDFGLDVYPNQIEIISSEQMLEAYSSVAMPIMYDHWSFGKQFIANYNQYKKGHMGLAYEVVINSDPCISYLIEENSMLTQALVIAHAAFGHNHFFKNNYLFKQWTNADSIIDYLVFAKNYIRECEEIYGNEAVENVLDSCHALMNYGVDRYKRPARISIEEEKKRQKDREEYLQSQVNQLWSTIPTSKKEKNKDKEKRFPEDPQENILYFLEKNSPFLEPWKRELIRIVRKISQYFYPQKQTKVMNEGFATVTHYNIIHRMREKNLIDDGYMLEFYDLHTSVVNQPPFTQYPNINVYALGFAMFQDMRRISVNPTDEDKEWFPDFAGKGDWKNLYKWAVEGFKDESFILQFLSPKVIRDMKLFSLRDDELDDCYEVTAIHNEEGYKRIRTTLSKQFDLPFFEPNIQVFSVDLYGDRSLTLHHYMDNSRRMLDQDEVEKVLTHIKSLWHFDVHLCEIDNHNDLIIKYSTKDFD